MDRIRWIDHKGIQILLEDFSGMTPGEEFTRLLNTAQKIIHSCHPKSVRALFNATDAMFDKETIIAMKSFTASNTPYIKNSAVLGIEGLLMIALQAVSKFSGRDFKLFKTREEALDWLISQ